MESDHAVILQELFELALEAVGARTCAVLLPETRRLLAHAPTGVYPDELGELRRALRRALPEAPRGRLETIVLPPVEPLPEADGQVRCIQALAVGSEAAVAFSSPRPLDVPGAEAVGRALAGLVLKLSAEHRRRDSQIKRVHDKEHLKDRFLSALSHELRSPLTVLGGLLELLAEEGPGPLTERQRAFLTQAQDQVSRLRWLTENLLDLSKIEAGAVDLSRGPGCIPVLVEKALSALRYEIERRGLLLEVDVDASLPLVCVDANRVTQVLVNLIDNAAKYTASGGTVGVSARETGAGVELCVRDTGRGIPAEEQAAVFDRYYRLGRRGAAGTGLGLSIAKEIVEIHGGRIWLESREGEGTRFFFTLPRYEPDASLCRFVRDVASHAEESGLPVTFSVAPVARGRGAELGDTVSHGSNASFEYLGTDVDFLVVAGFKLLEETRAHMRQFERRLGSAAPRWSFVEHTDIDVVMAEIARRASGPEGVG